MVAVRNQLRELQHPIEATSTLRGDNQSSLLVATTPGKHRSSLRHLELHAFQVKDFVDNGEIDVVWCPGDDCIADVYTKAVDAAKFKRFSSLLLLLTKFLERRDLVFDRRSSSTGPCP